MLPYAGRLIGRIYLLIAAMLSMSAMKNLITALAMAGP